jgi:ATP-binding cassette subfamily B multidrug efflux pump
MPHHEEEALGKGYDAQLMRRLLRYLRPYQGRVALALALVVVTSALSAVVPYFTKVVVDDYLLPGLSGAIAPDAAFRGIQFTVLIFFAVLVVIFALQVSEVLIMQLVGQKAMFDMRMQVFAHLQRLPMRFYDRNPVGRLVTRVTTDVDVIYELFASGVVTMLADFLTLAFIIGAMFWLDWRLTLTALAAIPLIVLVTAIFRRSYRDANRRIRTAIARINSFLNEYISGVTVVQLFNRERRAIRDFARINDDHRRAFKDAILAHAFFYPAVEFLGILSVAALLWFGGVRVLEAPRDALGHPVAGALTLGLVVSFIQYVQRMFRPIQDLSEKYTILQSAMASSERIFKLLDEPVHVAAAGADAAAAPALDTSALLKPRRLQPIRGEIEFRNVWFAYGSTDAKNPAAEPDWVLRDLSFRLHPGQTAAVVGHTGAGKTTIIQLLLRFYEVQRGQILLDGVDIRELDVHHLRRHFGIVLQDPFLFTGTLASNVRLGTDSIPRDTVRRALEEVRLGSLVDSVGLDAAVSERGATYSVGQRQLISFARALAHNPRFLILDEATSSVDTHTELLIREALDRLLTGRTAMVIAHRLSTIQRADQILVLHKGRLREQGSHQELLAARGIYYRLYQLQFKEQERLVSAAATDAAAALAGSSSPLPADD